MRKLLRRTPARNPFDSPWRVFTLIVIGPVVVVAMGFAQYLHDPTCFDTRCTPDGSVIMIEGSGE